MGLKDIRPKEFKVTIAGKECRLKYNYRAYAYVEENTGKNREETKKLVFEDDLSIKDEITIIQAGLLKYHSEITREQIEDSNPVELARSVIPAFLEPLLLPEILETIYFEKNEPEKKKTLFKKIVGCLNIPGQQVF